MASTSHNILQWKPEMESEATMAASGNTYPWKYDVFLSFRGADTRRGFISHLENALRQNQIVFFIDGQLSGGENISPGLLKKIEESNISVVVFSQNYADSPWCLDELVKICECMKRVKQIVLPVFYQVDPTDVQELMGSFGAALVNHERKFISDRVDSWRNALTEIANLKGYDFLKFESDAKLIEEIVSDIRKILEDMSSHDFPGLVGIEPRIKHVVSLMCIGSSESCTVGIWGMPGIGKTTIAEAVFHRVSAQFEGKCFVRAVREKILYRNDSIDVLIKYILSTLLGREDLSIETLITPNSVANRLRKKKFLLVLDDVDRSHLPLLQVAQQYGFISPKSRIILTSRDKQVLKNEGAKIYEVKELDHHEAFQLFRLHAFKQNYPSTGHTVLLERVARYCKGHPLAIRVLGSNLYNKSVEEWENELSKIEQSPDNEVQKILRISYDALDRSEKDVFLDIACFLHAYSRDRIESMLDGCGFYAKRGLSRLIDKSLITILDEDSIEMHDLLRQMGMDIVHEECIKEPEKRSRLWDYKDIYHVLTNRTETKRIEAICCEEGVNKELTGCAVRMDLSPTVFKKMCNLRLLIIGNIKLSKGLIFLPNSLVLLDWSGYPCKSLPSNFCPENLVELQMQGSCLEQLWDGFQPNLMKLKDLNLSNSKDLIRILDFSKTPNLKDINLSSCISLVEIPSSIGCCTNLTSLNLYGCKSLVQIPSSIGCCTNLTSLTMFGCASLVRIPSSIECCINLISLNLEACTSLVEVPSSIGCCTNLMCLDLFGCVSLVEIPSSIGCCTKLISLTLFGCINLVEVPPSIGCCSNLTFLDLYGCKSLVRIPSSIKCCTKLTSLNLFGCMSLAEIHSSIGCCTNLTSLNLEACTSLAKIPSSVGCCTNLTSLNMFGCISLDVLPSSIGCCTDLTSLDLTDCKCLVEIPSSIGCCINLIRLYLSGCENLIILPNSISNLKSLEDIDLAHCKRLQCLPKFPSSLRVLDASNCTSLRSIESLFTEDYQRTRFDFTNCINLDGSKMMDDAQIPCKDGERQIQVLIPGSEVPEWFTDKSATSGSFSVNWENYNCKIIGWAFCAVLRPKNNLVLASVKCYLEAEHPGGPRNDLGGLDYPCLSSQLDSEHVVLWYNQEETPKSQYITKASFECDGCEVIECGFHPVFAQLEEDENQGPEYRLSLSIAEVEDGNEEDEEVGSYPKRLKLETKELISLLPNQAEEDGINQEEECNDIQDWLSL